MSSFVRKSEPSPVLYDLQVFTAACQRSLRLCMRNAKTSTRDVAPSAVYGQLKIGASMIGGLLNDSPIEIFHAATHFFRFHGG